MRTLPIICFVFGLSLPLGAEPVVGRELEVTGFSQAGPVSISLEERFEDDVNGKVVWRLSGIASEGRAIDSAAAEGVFAACEKFIFDFKPNRALRAPDRQANSSKLYAEKGFFRVSLQWGKGSTPFASG